MGSHKCLVGQIIPVTYVRYADVKTVSAFKYPVFFRSRADLYSDDNPVNPSRR